MKNMILALGLMCFTVPAMASDYAGNFQIAVRVLGIARDCNYINADQFGSALGLLTSQAQSYGVTDIPALAMDAANEVDTAYQQDPEGVCSILISNNQIQQWIEATLARAGR